MIQWPAAIAQARATTPRWVWIALIASLAVNCLVLGIVFRSVWLIEGVHALGGGRFAAGLGGYVKSLPPGRREELRRIADAERPNLRPLRHELRSLKDEIRQILQTEPLDKERLAAVQSRILENEIEMRRAIHKSLAEIAARMTVEERRAFLSWRDERRRDRFRRPRPDDGGPSGSDPPPKQP